MPEPLPGHNDDGQPPTNKEPSATPDKLQRISDAPGRCWECAAVFGEGGRESELFAREKEQDGDGRRQQVRAEAGGWQEES